jgi:hypothetical protein
MLKNQQDVAVLKAELEYLVGILGPASGRYTKLNPSVFVPSVQTRNVRLSFIGAHKENSFDSDPKGMPRQTRINRIEMRRPSTTE